MSVKIKSKGANFKEFTNIKRNLSTEYKNYKKGEGEKKKKYELSMQQN